MTENKKQTKQWTFGEPEEPRKADPIGEPIAKHTNPAIPVKEEKCKYYYRGGLCDNPKVEKPFCPGVLKCPAYYPPVAKGDKAQC